MSYKDPDTSFFMQPSCRTDISLPVFLFFLLCLLLYHETVNYGWHLDDSPNILLNEQIHITNLQPATLFKTFFAHPVSSGSLFRPVANLTFSLNWLFGQNSAFGYHIVNIAIHLGTTVALYLSCLLLLQSSALKTLQPEQIPSIALLTASFWLIAPIHTQAVTYIVQRMAQLATFFSITAILFFLLFRFAHDLKKHVLYLILFIFSTILAIGSKENAILLPCSILLIEFTFFRYDDSWYSIVKRNPKKILLLSVTFLAAFSYLLQQYGTSIFTYDHRNFTLLERILTEPRILIFHLRQIFLPSAANLSIEHDVILSTSLFHPWNTLPAIILCSGLIALGFFRIRKNPLFSFAILFFFLNHAVESTVIHLELIFEHRNYLPSLFLFLPISAFIVKILYPSNQAKDNQFFKTVLTLSCLAFFIVSGIATYQRNKVWQNDLILWQDAVRKAPLNGRAKLNLAARYLNAKQFSAAIALCDQAEKLQGATKNKLIPISLNIKGDIAYAQGNIDQATTYFQQALTLKDDYIDGFYKLIAVLIEQGEYKKTLAMVNTKYQETGERNLLLIKASLLLRLNEPEKSLTTYQKAGRLFRETPVTLITEGMGKALSMLGFFTQADTLLNWAVKNDQGAILLLIENSLNAGENRKATDQIRQLLQVVPLKRLLDRLSTRRTDAYQIPFNSQLLRHAVLDVANNMPAASSVSP